MLELGAGADILRAFVWLYWGGLLLAVVLVLRFVKNGYAKLIGLLVVLGLFLGPVLLREWEVRRERDAFLTRQKVGQAHFQERCKTAGEKIARTVENVDGILLMKLRPERVDYYDQFTPDDVYGHDRGGEDYIKSFLRATLGAELIEEMREAERPRNRQGYAWVEAVDPKDKQLYRYRLRLFRPHDRDKKWLETHIAPELVRELIDKPTARYGLTWDGISTREDREQWVAGGVLKVIDLQSNEAIAERRGYMWDYGMGSRSGGRTPWLFAQQNACPEFPTIGEFDPRRKRTRREALNFVTEVVKPNTGE